MSRLDERPIQEFQDYIPWIRDDAFFVRLDCRPNFDVTVSGIAIPLYPAPNHYLIYINCDWMPAIFWRKNLVGNIEYNADWTVWKAHVSRLQKVETESIKFKMTAWGHMDWVGLDGYSTVVHDLFPHVEGWWAFDDDYIRSLRSWTLNGWYVKDDAMPVCYHTQPNHCPPLFDYADCIPLPGPVALERRMKMLIPDWKPDFIDAGLEYREAHPAATSDDIEIAASEFCEGYSYRDFKGNRIQPSQKATVSLYAAFCAAAGYLV